MQLALEHHQAGRLAEAEQLYRQVLGAQPNNPEALHFLGVIALQNNKHQSAVALIEQALRNNPSNSASMIALGAAYRGLGRFGEAESCYRKALALSPDHPEAHNNLGNILRDTGRREEAEYCFRRALAVHPGYIEAHNNLGNTLIDLQRFAEAEACFRRSLELDPRRAETHFFFALTLQTLGRVQEAGQSLRQAIALNPDHAGAHVNLGMVLRHLGRLDEAEQSLRRAIALAPNSAEAHNNLGIALTELGRFEEAQAAFQRAIALNPAFAEAHNNIGNALRDRGRFQEAEPCYREALRLKPSYVEAYNNLANVLKDLGRIDEAEKTVRQAIALKPDYAIAHCNLANILKDSGRLDEAEKSCRQALSLKPDFPAVHSNLIFLLDLLEGRGIEEQQQERRRWYLQHARRYADASGRYENTCERDRKLRVGYVSADFFRHSAFCTFGPIIRAHDRSAFEVYCYSGVKREDEVTSRLKAIANGWRSTVGIADDALADQIRRDRIDILVDLSGHSGGNRLLLFARKPAPVQVTAWGYATGTGLPTIDYFFADPISLPKKDRALFAEKVIDLPCLIVYEPHGRTPDVQPLPALTGAPFTFGCVCRIEKISARSLDLWSRILAEVTDSRLLIKGRGLEDERHRQAFSQRLENSGITSNRVELLGSSSYFEHLEVHHRVDVGLDPFPHSGGVGTAEALWMGVPIVTLSGGTIPSRLSASILTALNMKDWIARDDADYVQIAVKATQDLQHLAKLRQGLRARIVSSVFGDAKRYTFAVERAYRSMWKRWCVQAKRDASSRGKNERG
ncbi:MAG: tetratricopeptide repeat protein [Burkholderiales bacterium]